MENYEKEPSHIEHQIEPNPFSAPQYFHMEVAKDRSAKTMANKVLKILGPGHPIVLFAAGRALANAVSCAEIVKTYHKQIFQITRLGQVRTIETWEPTANGLDALKVTRAVPMMYILMSLEQLDNKEMGYQKSVGRRKDTRILAMSELSLSEDFVPVVPQQQQQSPSSSSSPTTTMQKERLTPS